MKIKKSILTTTLTVSLLLSTPIFDKNLDIYAVNKNEHEIIEAIINNDHINDIEKIEFDSKNKEVKSVENININSRASNSLNLQDGTYLIDRGDGWVLGNDSSFVESQIASAGESTKLMKGKTLGTITNIMVGSSIGIGLESVKLAVEAAYGHSIVKEDNLVAGFNLTAPITENVYAKTYITFKRYDMIEIRNRSIYGYTSTYEPNGTWLKYTGFTDSKQIDQNALKEKVNRSVLNEPEQIDIKSCISVSGCDHIKNLDIVLNSNDNTINLINRSSKPIHSGYGSQKYFSIELIDASTKKVKNSLTMTGNDFSNDSKYDLFNKIKYNIGDILSIYHSEPYLLNISGTYNTVKSMSSKQQYRITEFGLCTIN